jgi:hypothetical protein
MRDYKIIDFIYSIILLLSLSSIQLCSKIR